MLDDTLYAQAPAAHNGLALRLLRRPDGEPPAPARHPVAPAGSTIGRSPGCDLVLDDPFRMVSRRHAWLAPQGEHTALLRCISSSVEIKVNDQPVPPGGECVVHGGDLLDIGGFVLQLDAPGPARTEAAPAVLQRRPRLDQWFDLADAPDPLGPDSPLPPAVKPEPAATWFPPAALAGEVTVAMPSQPAAAPAVPAPPPQPKRPTVALPAAPASPPEPLAENPSGWREAVLRGAGLDAATPLQLDAAMMERLGALLRAATGGTLELLRSRALAKRSIRAEGTLIAARSNNPLKFTPDAAEAMAMLLAPKGLPGFLAPVQALDNAYDDLRIHQLAMLAGMRAALHDMIARLSPEATEQEEGAARGLAQRFPALREAALWRRHKAAYERMQAELDDVFEATFGREFVKAYEAQAKLAAQNPASTPPEP